VNEVWLDLVTNSAGRAVVRTTQPWQFAPGNGARSVIIHEEHTHTGPLDSGVAGARLGCLDVDF
jgi:Cu-Zn family superoxide dismutase